MSATLADAQAAYLDNADYLTTGSAAKAAAFVTAANQLLVLLPSVTKHGGAGELQWSLEGVQAALLRAEQWLRSNVAGSGAAGCVRYASFENFR